jgi:hypothetical protein
MPLTQQLSEQAEREKLEQQAAAPDGGHRSGVGIASILPHLSRTLRARPVAHDEAEGPPDEGRPA